MTRRSRMSRRDAALHVACPHASAVGRRRCADRDRAGRVAVLQSGSGGCETQGGAVPAGDDGAVRGGGAADRAAGGPCPWRAAGDDHRGGHRPGDPGAADGAAPRFAVAVPRGVRCAGGGQDVPRGQERRGAGAGARGARPGGSQLQADAAERAGGCAGGRSRCAAEPGLVALGAGAGGGGLRADDVPCTAAAPLCRAAAACAAEPAAAALPPPPQPTPGLLTAERPLQRPSPPSSPRPPQPPGGGARCCWPARPWASCG